MFFFTFVPFLFWAVEGKHNQIRGALSKRAEALERFLEKLSQAEGGLGHQHLIGRGIGRIPSVALCIIQANDRLKREIFIFEPVKLPGKRTIFPFEHNGHLVWRRWIVPISDYLFYFGQVALILALAIVLYSQSTSLKQQKSTGL